MSGAENFLDTNVVLCLLSGDPVKADRSEELLAGCTTLYSEDMHNGQVIDRQLTIRNPFAVGRG
jgi:predicted nucleic acid-binding protein